MPDRDVTSTGRMRAKSDVAVRGAMPLDFAISALVTLFVVVDPIGLAPTFLAVTEGLPRARASSVALRASVIAGAILIGTALIGDWLFDALGISLPAFRIAGGLLLFAIASEMVFGVRMPPRRRGRRSRRSKSMCATSPPFRWRSRCWPDPAPSPRRCCWPGKRRAICCWLASDPRGRRVRRRVCFVAFCSCRPHQPLLGITGNIVLSRLLGVLLAALAVQYVVDGIRALLGG